MSNSQAVSICKYCDIRSSKRVFAKDYCDSGVPFYRGKEIIEKYNGALNVSTELFISEEKFAELCSKLGAPQPGDLLLTSVGTLGIPYVVSPGERFYFKDGNLTWFYSFNGLDSRFLYYWLVSPTGKAELAKATIGSSQPAFTIVLLKDIQIACPPLCTQRKIASILSAYDDLIENNSRRIAILEEMAQAIYREWFVNFRFPGHENVKLVQSTLGMIPEGWERATLGQVSSNFDRIRVPLSSTQRATRNGPFPYYGASGVIDFIDDYLFDGKYLLVAEDGENINSRKLPLAFLAYGQFWVNNHAHILQGKAPVSTEFLLATLTDTDVNPYVTGAAQPKINQANLNRIPVIFPSKVTLNRFDEVVVPFFDERQLLIKKNHNLRTTRDLLLPKLISGQLDVEELDIETGEPLVEAEA